MPTRTHQDPQNRTEQLLEEGVGLLDDNGNPINAGNPLPVTVGGAPPSAPSNVRVIDRYNEQFIDVGASRWDGAPLTLAQWAQMLDGDRSTTRALAAQILIVFKGPVQLDEEYVINAVGAAIPGVFIVTYPDAPTPTTTPVGVSKVQPQRLVHAVEFNVAAPAVVGDVALKAYYHEAIHIDEEDYETFSGPIAGGATQNGPWQSASSKDRIVGFLFLSRATNDSTATLQVQQSNDGVTPHYISEFTPVQDQAVGNPVIGSGLGFEVDIIARYVRLVTTNLDPVNPITTVVRAAKIKGL
jgi:hypothetical protein